MEARRLLEALDRFLETARRTSKQRTISRLERRLEKAMASAFRAQGRALVARLRAAQGEIREAVQPEDWRSHLELVNQETLPLFEDPILEAVRSALEAGGIAGARALGPGLSFTLANPRAVAYLQDYGAKRVAGINETTRGYIQTVIIQGAAEGWSPDRMAREITARYEEFAVGRPQEHIASRAHLVAVTEVGDAYEEGNRMAALEMADAGAEMEKAWQTLGDGRVSAGCRDNEAEGWIPLNQVHRSGHQRPLRFPGCRCDEVYRVKAQGGKE